LRYNTKKEVHGVLQLKKKHCRNISKT